MRYVIVCIALAFYFCVDGCSKLEQPLTSDVEKEVGKLLQQGVPISWTGNLMGGKNAKIVDLKIIRKGIYNEKAKYWSYELQVKGICELNDSFNQGNIIHFDKLGHFILYRDDYGDWKASLKRGMFQ